MSDTKKTNSKKNIPSEIIFPTDNQGLSPEELQDKGFFVPEKDALTSKVILTPDQQIALHEQIVLAHYLGLSPNVSAGDTHATIALNNSRATLKGRVT